MMADSVFSIYFISIVTIEKLVSEIQTGEDVVEGVPPVSLWHEA